jgi:hypothetical protein
MDASTTELVSTTLGPKYIYCYRNSTRQLCRTNLLTGKQSCHQVRGYEFRSGCRWSELPGGSLLITGGFEGYLTTLREAVKIDTPRECAVSSLPPMHTARQDHAAVYHSQYVYVLAGFDDRCLRECERYSIAQSRWEVLPVLPVAGYGMSAVVLANSLYALGGSADAGNLDTIQRLSLPRLTWELMRLNLPQAANHIPCFETDTKVYLVIKETLYSFTPLEVKPLKTLPQYIDCVTSYYSRGTLYYASFREVKSLDVGELTSL